MTKAEVRELEADVAYLKRRAIQLIDQWMLASERLKVCQSRLEKMTYALPDGRTR